MLINVPTPGNLEKRAYLCLLIPAQPSFCAGLACPNVAEESAPRITQLMYARGESVQPLIVILFMLKTRIAVRAPPNMGRYIGEARRYVRNARHVVTPSRARNVISTGRPAKAASSK